MINIPMMSPEFRQLIDIAIVALEQEDKNIRDAIDKNQMTYHGETGGILRFNLERFFQLIIAKSLILTFPFMAEVEKDWHDIVLYEPGDVNNYVAAIEMKLWMSVDGKREIPSILTDIDKLIETRASKSLMLIVTANPPYMTNCCINEMSEFLCNKYQPYHRAFTTVDRWDHSEVEFVLLGYQIK